MIVLDTNVLSELMRAQPDHAVLEWFTRQPIAGLFTTAVSQAEIHYCLALLPAGKRRDSLREAARAVRASHAQPSRLRRLRNNVGGSLV